MTTAMAEGTPTGTETGLDQRRRAGHGKDKEVRKEKVKRVYAKEATVTVDLTDVSDARAEDIIKAVTEKIGDGKILAVRPKQMHKYEVTLEKEEDTEELMDGLIIKGENCEVQKLQNRDYVVSFMHLPVYMDDEDVLKKLEGWGVFPVSKIKRRVYPGTSIEDGTRFVKTRFPREVISLPYSTKLETAEGPQYFRVMHSHQVKTCRLCMSPDHIVKDCPDYKCYKCSERGHFARDCKAVKCPDCKEVLNKCECWMRNEDKEEEGVNRQVHEGDSEKEQDEEQEEELRGLQNNESTGNKDTEDQEEECNGHEIQSQQEKETWTQMDVTESLQSELDTVELNDQRNIEQVAVKESEGGKAEEEKQLRSTKRRRLIKVTPNLETARKKVLKEDSIETGNKYDVLKDLQENELK
ncbi:hypothetical protein PO909_026843 [Leuciscus waleckii]